MDGKLATAQRLETHAYTESNGLPDGRVVDVDQTPDPREEQLAAMPRMMAGIDAASAAHRELLVRLAVAGAGGDE